MGKNNILWKGLDLVNSIANNPYSHCPKCHKKCYCISMEGNGMLYYGAIRKTTSLIPKIGSSISRFAADNIVHPTFEFYCHDCDYSWKSKKADG